MDEAFVFFALIATAIGIALSHLMNKLKRRRATYRIYEARDKFVLLVASGLVEEDSPFFKYYYKRLNTLLSRAPNIGVDDAVKSLLKYRNNVSFQAQMEQAKAEHERIQNCKEMSIEEAAMAAQFFYFATREMILAHSSILRLCFNALSHITNDFWRTTITDTLPRNTQKALAAARFTTEEVQQLKDRQNYAH